MTSDQIKRFNPTDSNADIVILREIAYQLAKLNERQDEQWEFDQSREGEIQEQEAADLERRKLADEALKDLTRVQERMVNYLAPEPAAKPLLAALPFKSAAQPTPSTSTEAGSQTKENL